MLKPVLELNLKDKLLAYVVKIARALKMLFASCANVLLFQMIEILLGSRNPSHSFSVLAALAYDTMLGLVVVF
jgi:hypothetical protein